MAEEAVTAVEKGSPSAMDEGSMPTKTEMAAWTEMGTNAAHVHSAEPSAMHPKTTATMHATEAAAAMHDECKRLWRLAPARMLHWRGRFERHRLAPRARALPQLQAQFV